MSVLSAKNVIPSNFTIPTIPAVVQRISSMLQDPNTGVREIAAVVAEDAPLAAKVLKIANSAYYGLRERCMSTQHATAVLGVRVLRNVVMQASVIQQFEHLEGTGFDLQAQWKHSILTAQICSFAAKRSKVRLGLTPEELYVCGLLHDIGKVALLDNLKNSYTDVAKMARDKNLPLYVLERSELGFDHTDVGVMIAMRWSLPQAIATAIQFHHGPEDSIQRDPIVALVARINQFAHHITSGNLIAATSVFDPQTLRLVGMNANDVEALVQFAERTKAGVEV
jgi:putative nucleotidyltransferase with HDIG domain